MKYLVLSVCALSVLGFIKPQYDSGIDQSLHWAQTPYHPLQQSVEVGRSFQTLVKFNKPFKSTPTVILAPIKYDFGDTLPQGFDIQLSAVNTVGFTITYVALSPATIFGFDVSWAAILDSNIYTYELQTNNLPVVKSNKDGTTRAQPLEVTFPENWSLKSAPNVAIFILGLKMVEAWPKIAVNMAVITKTSAQFKVTVGQKGTIEFIRVNMIIGEKDTLLVGTITHKTSGAADPLNAVAPESERVKKYEEKITDEIFLKTPRYTLYGISGLYYNYGAFCRFLTKNYLLVKDKLSVEIGTWQNSQLLEGQLNWFVYVPKPDAGVTDPDCAQVWESCNYQGDSFTVCDRKMSFPKDGWNKPVKSFKVPDGKVLKVYNEENLKGLSIRIEKDLPCMEVPKFSFLQLVGSLGDDKFWDSD
ncbi:unnamed protein product (macronuclear) [Paramecium tetraurelia]|uniref:H-type lectin domain-containing protein n=1 Tax=Paramecium tetraurelia TaxID=5888 RepID=A0CDA9_PARTE|nr:uncharacterized protein GSPATT00006987001 [Paramecium tetraurelia]CAK68776.1 unnamed protein product [Paramecium tetraurelia]|eukprot:XP_001436173.1 hypothetical protein (macronuclear) [Paramecium tetraurelia strain d4-2]